MKCKFYSEVTDKCAFDGPLDDCPYQDDPNKCNCFEPKMDEDEFYKKYCRKCSLLVCGSVRDTVSREGCRYYRQEMKKETPDNSLLLEGVIPLKGCKIALPKYSARISIGSLQINLTNKTFTEEQIKNMKEMLGWEVENL